MNTVFIIGAGASKELDFPVGDELRDKISYALSTKHSNIHTPKVNDDTLDLTIRNLSSHDKYSLIRKAGFISENIIGSKSIDNFIDSHKNDDHVATIGKSAIFKLINDEEFKFHNKAKKDFFGSFANTWYINFFQQITEQCTFKDLKNRLSKISLIIFNYDRCFEYFITQAIMNFYSVDNIEASQVISNMFIYHPYGSLGDFSNDQYGHQFGGESSYTDISLKYLNLLTFTEGAIDPDGKLSEAHQKLYTCDRLVFLGFAYSDLNLSILKSSGSNLQVNYNRYIYGTAFGISSHNTDVIKKQLSKSFLLPHDNIFLVNKKCRELLPEFEKALSFNINKNGGY